ncbi:MAG: spondin domain-containing protein [Woeseiaceae bacterium]
MGGNTGTTDPATYRITFDVDWTAADFPTNYPSNPHFSPLVGTTHNSQVVFWELDGQPASDGIESMAERGRTATLGDEILAARDNGYSVGVIEGSGIGSGDGETSIEFDISVDYPLITFVSMIAPSPDWFVGVRGMSLLDAQGNWVDRADVPLEVYDAGTDLGERPRSADNDSNADNLPVTLLSSDRNDTDFEQGVHFQSSRVVGMFIIEKI